MLRNNDAGPDVLELTLQEGHTEGNLSSALMNDARFADFTTFPHAENCHVFFFMK